MKPRRASELGTVAMCVVALLLALTSCSSPNLSKPSAAPTTAPQHLDAVAWIAACLRPFRLGVSPAPSAVTPTHTPAQIIAELVADNGRVMNPGASAHFVSLTRQSPSQGPGPFWVVISPTGTNRISAYFQPGIGQRQPTSPLDGQPVYTWTVVPDWSKFEGLGGFCASRAKAP